MVHNHKTGFTQLIDPQSFVIIDPRTDKTNRSALVPFGLPPIGHRDVPAMDAPSTKKVRNPLDPVFRAKQLRIPPRSDKERRGFYGR